MKAVIEDFGVQARSDTWLTPRHGRNPKTGVEVGIVSLYMGGFMVIDPKEKCGTQVRPPRAWQEARVGTEAWAIGQAPDGTVYVATSYSRGGKDAVLAWNWEGTILEKVFELPSEYFLSLDVASDGRIYLAEYVENVLFRYDPSNGKWDELGSFGEYGGHVRNPYCA